MGYCVQMLTWQIRHIRGGKDMFANCHVKAQLRATFIPSSSSSENSDQDFRKSQHSEVFRLKL